MKTAELQQFVNGLAIPVKAAGASDKVCAEIRQVAEFLEPFKDKSLADLATMLRMIDEFQRTKQWPEPQVSSRPSRRSSKLRATKMTVQEAAQVIMALTEKITDPELEYTTIDAEIKRIEPLTVADLKAVAQEVGMVLASKKKPDIVAEIRRKLRDRKANFERAQFRPAEQQAT